MLTICAWCQVVLTLGEPPISHGICKPCADKLYQDLETYLKENNDKFSEDA